MKKNIVLIVIYFIVVGCLFAVFFKINHGSRRKNIPGLSYVPTQRNVPPESLFPPESNVHPESHAPAVSNVPAVINIPGGDRVVYSNFLTEGTGDAYCASLGLQCTNLGSCQLDKGGCKESEYCGDTRTPECPCTARCASSPNITDDENSCGSCRWVDIECSRFGGIWTGSEVSCNPENAGVIVMKKNKNNCGPQHLEAYTSEEWDSCFTPRAQCVCQ
jgi:hypothetical protein